MSRLARHHKAAAGAVDASLSAARDFLVVSPPDRSFDDQSPGEFGDTFFGKLGSD
jgi:hypothetical protein